MAGIGLAAAIIALIAMGCLVAYAVVMTMKWLIAKIKEKIARKRTRQVVIAILEDLIKDCDNTMSMDALEGCVDKGYTHVMASVDDNGKVRDVEMIQDTNDTIDEEVERLINRTGQGMLVVEG